MHPMSPEREPGSGAGQEEQAAESLRYCLPNLDGEWTVEELVEMDTAGDRRLSKVRRRDLPREFWEARRRARNRRRTLRQKEARRVKRSAEGEQVERTEEERQQAVQAHLAQQARLEAALEGGLRVAVDCSFHDGASWREVRSLAKQLQLCVGANKKAPAPLGLHFVGFKGRLKEFAEGDMNALRWPARLVAAPAVEAFSPADIVLLSPDAEQPLLELDPTKVYVVGGLVDRTVQKQTTAEYARRHGLDAARLPVREFLGAQQAQQGQQAGMQMEEEEQQQQQMEWGEKQAQQQQQQAEMQQAEQQQHTEEQQTDAMDAEAGAEGGGKGEHGGPQPAVAAGAPAEASGGSGPGTGDGKKKRKKEGKAEGSFILNIDTVVSVLLAVHGGEGWADALQRLVPQRKQKERRGTAGGGAVLGGELQQQPELV